MHGVEQVKRRDILVFIGGLLANLPSVPWAQQTPQPLEFGMLFPGPADGAAVRAEFLWRGLKEKGFIEGKNVALLSRAAAYEPDGLSRLAKELASSDAKVIVAVGPPAVRAVKDATTKPIIAIDLETDPVASGLVASLARPGGNLTGLFLDFPEFAGKWLELLQQAVPKLARVAVFWDPTTGRVQVNAAEAAARQRGLNLHIIEIKDPSGFENAFALAMREKTDGLVILSSPLFGTAVGAKPVAELAARYRLPAISPFPEFAQVGGLMGYGTSVPDLFHQAGVLVGRVLKGEKPADMPVERPTRLRLTINMKVAKTLNLDMPLSLTGRADEVIE